MRRGSRQNAGTMYTRYKLLTSRDTSFARCQIYHEIVVVSMYITLKDAKLTVCVVVVPKYTLVYVQLLFEVQAKSQVFSGLDAKETALLEKYITVLSAPKNAYVLTAGSRPAFLGVVARGHLEAYTDNKRLVS